MKTKGMSDAEIVEAFRRANCTPLVALTKDTSSAQTSGLPSGDGVPGNIRDGAQHATVDPVVANPVTTATTAGGSAPARGRATKRKRVGKAQIPKLPGGLKLPTGKTQKARHESLHSHEVLVRRRGRI